MSNVIACPLRVVDENGADVPADGETVGELVARGNDVMLGYYRDPEATAASLVDGWFKTGDVAVMHPDSYVEIRDRSKDIIITGGENVASIEVEQVLVSHPSVLEAAVAAQGGRSRAPRRLTAHDPVRRTAVIEAGSLSGPEPTAERVSCAGTEPVDPCR